MPHYVKQSCHEIYYHWNIEAPEALPEEHLNEVLDTLCDYTDEPSQEEYNNMLTDGYYMEDLQHINMKLLKQVKIDAENIDRRIESQDVTPLKSE